MKELLKKYNFTFVNPPELAPLESAHCNHNLFFTFFQGKKKHKKWDFCVFVCDKHCANTQM